jgi:hypothetical protein
MSVIFSSRKKCYCAFCRSPRKVYRKKNIHLVDILGSALGAGSVMFAIFQEFDPRVILIFIAFLALAEIFIQVRWRIAIVCKQCGFDPVLYVRDTQKAVLKVQMHLDRRKLDPASLLSPALNLPTVNKERSELIQKAHAGSLVSKRI